jgi:uncharacterized membrane protein YjdF
MHSKTSKILNSLYIIFQSLLIVAFIRQKNSHYAIEAGAILTLYLILIFFEYKKKFSIDNFIRAMLILTLIGNDLIGNYLNIYNMSDSFDKALHFFGAFTFALFAYSLLYKTVGISIKSKLIDFILISSIGITLGTFLEMIEFVIDLTTKAFCQKGLWDTDMDLLFNIFGSLAAGFYKFLRYKHSPHHKK